MNLVENQCFFSRNLEEMPPWGVFFAYRICVAHLLSGRETPKSSTVVKKMRETLLTTDARWNAAGIYYISTYTCEINHYYRRLSPTPRGTGSDE